MGLLSLLVAVALVQQLPSEPVIFNTKVGYSGLILEPTDPRPIVGVLLVACRNNTFQCADNGAEFRVCARWELSELGLRNPRSISGKCIADRIH